MTSLPSVPKMTSSPLVPTKTWSPLLSCTVAFTLGSLHGSTFHTGGPSPAPFESASALESVSLAEHATTARQAMNRVMSFIRVSFTRGEHQFTGTLQPQHVSLAIDARACFK